MKDDVEIPTVVPKKRRQIEHALDKWIAVWLSRDDLTPSERRRLEAEKQRRKTAAPTVAVGILVGDEGLTPQQRAWLSDFLAEAHVDELHWPERALPHLRKVARDLSPGIETHATHADVVRAATIVVAAPKETEKPAEVSGVWEAVRLAKHRSLPVKIVMPNGEERT